MPAKRKWTGEELSLSNTLFLSEKTQQECADEMGVYNQALKRLWVQQHGLPAVRQRYAQMCRLSKTGELNPMHGKKGALHHCHKDSYINTQGYRMVDAPDWYAGPTKSGKAMEHIVVWCEGAGISRLPRGYVVHHKDEDRLHNDRRNLQMMTIGAHMRHHNLKV